MQSSKDLSNNASMRSAKPLQLDDRRWARWLIALLALALLLRLGLMLTDHRGYGGDESQYAALARQLANTGAYVIPEKYWDPIQGGRPGDPTAFRTPVFPMFLAMHYAVFGPTDFAPKLGLVLISALSCSLLAILGGQIGSRIAGLAAGFLWAVWPPAILSFYSAHHFYSENLGIFLLLGSYCLIVGHSDRATVQRAAAAGLLMALAVLTRPYLILLVPGILVWLPFARQRTTRMRSAVAFASACVLVIGAWTIRNMIALGSPVLSTQSEHIYMGNNQWARGSMNGDVWTLGTAAPQFQVVEARNPGVWSTSELERCRIWNREGRRAIIQLLKDPKRFVWLMSRKIALYLSPLQDWSYGVYRHHYALLPLWGLIALGMWRGGYKRQLTNVALLTLPVLATLAVSIVAYAHDRFRYSCEPFLVLLAVLALVRVRSPEGAPEDLRPQSSAQPTHA